MGRSGLQRVGFSENPACRIHRSQHQHSCGFAAGTLSPASRRAKEYVEDVRTLMPCQTLWPSYQHACGKNYCPQRLCSTKAAALGSKIEICSMFTSHWTLDGVLLVGCQNVQTHSCRCMARRQILHKMWSYIRRPGRRKRCGAPENR